MIESDSDSLISKRGIPENKKYKHPLYGIWVHMKERCYSESRRKFKYYGGKGVVVCERWMDFWKFVEDVGERPSTRHTLERKNNDGIYEKSNVVWATQKQQVRNRSITVMADLDGEVKPLGEWCEIYGKRYKAVWQRIKSGWGLKEALDTPFRKITLRPS